MTTRKQLADLASAQGLVFRELTDDEKTKRRSNASHALIGAADSVIVAYAFPFTADHPAEQRCCDLVESDLASLKTGGGA